MSKKHKLEMTRDQKTGLYVPKEMATEIGFGCPKCDDHCLVPVSQTQFRIPEIVAAFRKKHENCGTLHTLEKRGKQVYATSEVPSRAVVMS